jgi:hypothetical protein
MLRASEIVSFRALGLSLAQIAQTLDGDSQSLESVLAAHEASLEQKIRELVGSIDRIRGIRSGSTRGHVHTHGELAGLRNASTEFRTAFDLPWPWGGERFELREIRPLNYIIGSLGSGKTRLAICLAETLSNATFLGLDRVENGPANTARLESDAAIRSRIDRTLTRLIDEGASASEPLTAMIVGLETQGPAVLVVDMIEHGLDQATQEALIIHLRRRAAEGARPLFMMTRSASILDLSALGPHESIILCPANHSPPIRVAPYAGTPGYEAVATCLASPQVRARIARCPQTA